MIKIDKTLVDKIKNSNFLVLREKKTDKALAIALSEDGLRTKANKNGVYFYCEGRVHNLNKALKAPRNRNLYVENFSPKQFKEFGLNKIESHYIEEAIHRLNFGEYRK